MYGVASPIALYLRLDQKEENTRPIVSQLSSIQFHKIKMTLQYVHVEGEFVSTKGGRRGKTGMW